MFHTAGVRRAVAAVLLVAAVAVTLPDRLGAAELGALQGRVTDPAGAPLAGATLTLTRPARGTDHGGAVTDARGGFRIAGLPAGGRYRLTTSFTGFATVVISEIVVNAGTATSLTVSLTPEGELREQVQVRASPPMVALTETTTQSRYSSEFIDALPILGRNYQEVLTLAPGVSDVDGDGNPNIHGARDTDVNTLVDGVSTTDPYTGKVGAQLNIESIQEIEVKTSGATAEFGRAQGGFANILTKSGGNEFEGSFKFYWRGSALDGDGAGIDDPSLHGGVGEHGLRDLEFNDFLPFVSLGGPIARDRVWFFATLEYIQREDPVNAVNAAFVTGLQEFRAFGKVTWQVTDNTRLALSLNHDPQEFLNQGLNSLTREETGFTYEQGGTNLTLRSVSVLSPSVVLEGTAGFLDTHPGLTPNLGLDTNGDGTLFVDWNGDGFQQSRERDPGQDYDGDGAWDVFEDLNRDGRLQLREDVDGDGHLTQRGGCEGAAREDFDCDGRLDALDEDADGDGFFDGTEDLDMDRYFDRGIEDRNGDGLLNDAAYPTDLYPYGALRPRPRDRDYLINEVTGITEGPYFESLEDTRRRVTARADLSVFVADRAGSHDLRFGGMFERESFDRSTERNHITALQPPIPPICLDNGTCVGGHPESAVALIPVEAQVQGEATGGSGALYVQNLWRPRPNLSLGLGLRYEHETGRAPGYTFFDPRAQRDTYDVLVTLSGGERTDDLLVGNRDGLANQGILGDPFVTGGDGGMSGVGADLVNALRLQAIRHLTRHRSNIAFTFDALSGLYGGLGGDGELDPEQLAALGVSVQQPQEIALTNDNLSPRLAVSWDPASDGRTKLFATWGRYYDRLFLNTLVGEQGPDTISRYYDVDHDGLDVTGFTPYKATPNHNLSRLLNAAPPSVRQVDRGLSTPYSDEWSLGFEREIAPETAVAVRFIRRDFRDQLQDVDINHELVIDPATGEPYDQVGVQFEIPGAPAFPGGPIVTPPIEIALPDGRPDLYIQNPFFNQILRVENSNTARYSALEVELRRRLARRWQMQASYVYSRAQGNAEDFQSRVGNDPSVTESEYGYLSYDQRHVVKANAAVFLPRDFQLGVAATWSSGLPYSVISRFFSSDNLGYTQFRTRFGSTAGQGTDQHFVTLPRNSERNDAVLDLNMSVRKTFVLGRTLGAVSLDVANLLNSDDLHIVSYEPVLASSYDLGGAVPVDPLQLDATRRFGRRFQLGFQFSF